MKKIKNALMILFLVMAVASCSNDDDGDFDNDLVGTWELTESEDGIEFSILAKFNSNETGELATSFTFGGETSPEESFDFTWSTDGNKLTMVIEGETEVSTYSISGDRLTITDDEGDSTVLTRV